MTTAIKWVYETFMIRRWPATIQITFNYNGKGSFEGLYNTTKDIPFDKPLALKFVAKNDEWTSQWDVEAEVRKAYKQFILDECKKELIAARKEKYIDLEDEERITGDYIVSVEASTHVKEWKRLTYEEYLLMKAETLNAKRKSE